jgi:hypothetical protein
MSTPFRLPEGRAVFSFRNRESVPHGGFGGEYRVTPTWGTSPMLGLRHKQ